MLPGLSVQARGIKIAKSQLGKQILYGNRLQEYENR